MSLRLASLALAAAPLLAACAADPTAPTSLAPEQPRAIVYGFNDQQNTFSNVGAFIVRRPSDGRVYPICSGTLISSTVFLTAAHCTQYFETQLAPLGWTAGVSFANPLPWGALTDLTQIAPIWATDVVSDPEYSQRQSDPADIGVLILPSRATQGITPATLPSAGLLDQLFAAGVLKRATFTAVGYGLQDRVTGGGPPTFTDENPVPRKYAYSSFNALNKAYLRLSQNPATGNGGTCYGDSGGPNFLDVNGTRVLAAITITGDAVCRSTNVDYRMDNATARRFLGQYVTLP